MPLSRESIVRVGVTGATSGIGLAVIKELGKRHHEVVRLVRTEGLPHSRFFDLSVVSNEPDLWGLDSVIHLAWDWTGASTPSPNISGGIRLLRQCHSSGVRPILLSTDSVYAPRSRYGHQKRELEATFKDAGGQVVRSGIIWGANATGIVRTLWTISKLPLPCLHFKPKTLLRHSQIEYVARELVSSAEQEASQETVHAWSNETVSLEMVLHAGQTSRFRPHIPMPIYPLHRVADLLDILRISSGIRPDSLRGLQTARSGYPLGTDECGLSDFPGTNEFLDWFKHSIRPL